MGNTAQGYRWLIHATNGWGLGHVARTLALARQIRARSPKSEILFLTNSEASNLIWREGFASVKLPSAQSIHQGLIESRIAIPLGRALTASVAAAFRPQVLVSDTFPLGGNSELLPMLASWAHRILIYREVPKTVVEVPEIQEILRRYHLILSAHHPGQVPMSFPPSVKVKEVGDMLIRSRDEGLPREEARRRLGLPIDGFHVFFGLGGGGDDRYKEFFERIVAKAQSMAGWTLVWPVPPLLRKSGETAVDSRVKAVSYFPLAEVWQAFDGAITFMGANTLAELMHNGVPTIFLPPREGMADDQRSRADRIGKHGAGWVLKSLDDAALTAAFSALADSGWRAAASNNARKLVPINGAAAAAEFLLSYLKTIKNPGLAPPFTPPA